MIEVKTVPHNSKPEVYDQIRRVFFESTKRQFKNQQDKDDFFDRWAGYYIESSDCDILIASEDEQIYGYLAGCKDTVKHLNSLKSKVQSVAAFEDQFECYPCHIHINLGVSSRGRGIGSILIQEYCKQVAAAGYEGIHAVTSPQERNVSFYKKNGFDFELERKWKDFPLLFVGKRLRHQKV